MKKRLRLFMPVLAFILCFSLVSCNGENTKPDAEDAGGSYYVKLDTLPDIGEYKKDTPAERFYPEYTDRLIPSDSYGTLIPYAGAGLEYTPAGSSWSSFSGYGKTIGYHFGLCNTEGKIVTDAVFASVDYYDDGYYVLSKDSQEGERRPAVICNSTGSTVTEIDRPYFYISYLADGLFMGALFVDPENNYEMNSVYTNEVFDINGNIKLSVTCDDYSSLNNDGLGNIIYTEYDPDTYECKMWAFDKEFNRSRKVFRDIIGVKKGVFIVSEFGSSLYGVTDDNGKYLIKPTFNCLTASETGDFFVGLRDGKLIKITPDGTETQISNSLYGDVSSFSLISDDLIEYCLPNEYKYFSLTHGELKYDSVYSTGKYTVCNTEASASAKASAESIIFDEEMNTVATLSGDYYPAFSQPDDSRYIALEGEEGLGIYDTEKSEWAMPESVNTYIAGDDIVCSCTTADDEDTVYDLYFMSKSISEPFCKSLKNFITRTSPLGTILICTDNSYTTTMKVDGTVIMKIRSETD